MCSFTINYVFLDLLRCIMQTQVTFRHLKSRPDLNEAAMEAVQKFEKFHEGITSTTVEFIAEAHNVVEFKCHINGNVLVVKESSDDFLKSLNEAADKMIRQLKKHRDKNS